MCCCACNKCIQRDFFIFYLEVWILDVNQRICFFYSKLRVHRSLSLRKFLVSIFLIYISVAEEVCLKSAQSQYRRAINRASEIQSQYRRAWVLTKCFCYCTTSYIVQLTIRKIYFIESISYITVAMASSWFGWSCKK